MTERRPLERYAAHAVRLAGAWILFGALMKLFRGTPADLPSLVRELAAGRLDLTFRAAIAAELCIASATLLDPRRGFWPASALFVVFDAVLVVAIARGESECGCLGSGFSLPPAVMLAIDTALLAAMLVTRGWRAPPAAPRNVALLALACAVGIAAPWIAIPPSAPSAPPAPSNGSQLVQGGWKLPDPLPRYADLEPQAWIGKPLVETQLALWLDPAILPTDSRLVLYRQTCEHCARHLAELAATDTGLAPLHLVRIAEPHDSPDNELTVVKPDGPHVTELVLTPRVQFVVEPPWDVAVEGGIVTAAEQHRD